MEQLRTLLDSGQFDQIKPYLDQQSESPGKTAEWWCDVGSLLRENHQEMLAIIAYNYSIKKNPYFICAYFELADILIEKRKYQKAEKSLVIANQIIRNNGLLEGKLGLVYLEMGRYKDCVWWVTRAIQHEEGVPDLYNILGDGLLRLGRMEEAKIILVKGITIAPQFPRLLNTVASYYALQKDFEQSNQCLVDAIKIEPEFPQAHVKYAVNLLTTGKLSKGWKEYEYRKVLPVIRSPDYGCPEWDGSSLKGKTILIWTEQGFGDTIQYFRYVRKVKNEGATVIFECRSTLKPLFENNPWIDQLIIRGQEHPEFDTHLSVMSLPRFFEKKESDRVVSIPYIFPNTTVKEPLKKFILDLRKVSKPKIGLTWAGNPDNKNDYNRSINPVYLKQLAINSNIQFINLQFNSQSIPRELAESPDPTPFIKNFADTAMVLKELDLLISVDTSICHLAGALGLPVWTLIPWTPDFRWGLKKNTTTYYPTMRIFRQPDFQDWESVIQDVIKTIIEEYIIPQSKSGRKLQEGKKEVKEGKIQLDSNQEMVEKNLIAKNIELEDLVRQNPSDPILQARLGILQQQNLNYEQAEKHYLIAQRLKPDFPEVFHNLAVLYKDTKRLDEGLVYIEKALKYYPENVDYLNTQGSLYLLTNLFKKAEDCFLKAIELAPEKSSTYTNISTLYLACHKLSKAEEAIEKACEINPDGNEENWNRAIIHLSAGEYSKGFKEYEYRWQKDEFQKIKRRFQKPEWDGSTQKDKTIFVWPEQGYGDTIQFVRYIPLLKQKFKRVIVEVQPGLHSLVDTMEGPDQVVSSQPAEKEFDYHIPLMSIPQYFTQTLADVPRNTPYFYPRRKDTYFDFAPYSQLKKIGIVWSGSPTHDNDHNRSCSFNDYSTLFQLPGTAFFSLQVGPGRNQFLQSKSPVIDLAPFINTFEDTAVLIQSLDLIISIDSAVVHLAGALRKKSWLLLPYRSDWRWLFNRKTTPWYPGVKLFRQTSDCSWETVFSKLYSTLHADLIK